MSALSAHLDCHGARREHVGGSRRKHLAEKILTSKAALDGERKQVTVLFADLKGSMELLAGRDPEEARQILDTILERMMAAVHLYEGPPAERRRATPRAGSRRTVQPPRALPSRAIGRDLPCLVPMGGP